ncbi:MAG: RNA polymerase sigma factor [Polyangiaceae bacterium]|nr:RNA polymerase sigma factor [Polyangiaceae bacterium]
MAEAHDEDLVARLRVGDARAFDETFARFRSPLFGFISRMVRRRDVAEDLLQETFLRLARHAAGLEPNTRLGAWLFTVAKNLVHGYRRWSLLDVERLLELGWQPKPASTSPYDHALASERSARLELALSALPGKYREALLLVAERCLEPGDAAAILGLSPEAFRKRLSRARAMLQERVARLEKDPSR